MAGDSRLTELPPQPVRARELPGLFVRRAASEPRSVSPAQRTAVCSLRSRRLSAPGAPRGGERACPAGPARTVRAVRTRRLNRCVRPPDRTEAIRASRKQFFIENIVGAGGNIGTGRGARAAADGYTLVAVASHFVTNPILYDAVPPMIPSRASKQRLSSRQNPHSARGTATPCLPPRFRAFAFRTPASERVDRPSSRRPKTLYERRSATSRTFSGLSPVRIKNGDSP